MEVFELTASPADLAVLRILHETLYLAEFPDRNEQTSFEDMSDPLARKSGNLDRYHILAIQDGGLVLGFITFDWLAEANTGVVEYVVTSPAARRRKVGTRLFTAARAVMNEDAQGCGYPRCDLILAEVNDPELTPPESDGMDPWARVQVWSRWGFKRVEAEYIQPSIGADKAPVRTLMLMARTDERFLSADRLLCSIRNYMRWAMGYRDPTLNSEYAEMASKLSSKIDVLLTLPLKS